MAKATASANGIGLFGALTVLFVALKLTGHINWSWVWVLAPTWIPFVLFLLVVLGIVATVHLK